VSSPCGQVAHHLLCDPGWIADTGRSKGLDYASSPIELHRLPSLFRLNWSSAVGRKKGTHICIQETVPEINDASPRSPNSQRTRRTGEVLDESTVLSDDLEEDAARITPSRRPGTRTMRSLDMRKRPNSVGHEVETLTCCGSCGEDEFQLKHCIVSVGLLMPPGRARLPSWTSVHRSSPGLPHLDPGQHLSRMTRDL
jgi:hypothetical protein